MMVSRTRSGGTDGFTLVELMVVVLIVGLLAAIAAPRLNESRERAHFASIGQDFRNLGAAQERYYQANMLYAQNLASLDFAPTSGVQVAVTEATNQGWAAVGTHQALEDGGGCSIYLGSATAPPLPNGQAHGLGPGVVQCTQ